MSASNLTNQAIQAVQTACDGKLESQPEGGDVYHRSYPDLDPLKRWVLFQFRSRGETAISEVVSKNAQLPGGSRTTIDALGRSIDSWSWPACSPFKEQIKQAAQVGIGGFDNGEGVVDETIGQSWAIEEVAQLTGVDNHSGDSIKIPAGCSTLADGVRLDKSAGGTLRAVMNASPNAENQSEVCRIASDYLALRVCDSMPWVRPVRERETQNLNFEVVWPLQILPRPPWIELAVTILTEVCLVSRRELEVLGNDEHIADVYLSVRGISPSPEREETK